MSADVEWLEAANNGLMESQERLAAEVASLTPQLEAATKACDDLNVQCRFWRQCAEHAVTGWNRLEDSYEDLLGRVRALLKSEPQDVDGEAWRKLELFVDDREEWAPPAVAEAPDAG